MLMPLVGGMLIGLAAVLLYGTLGRIAGISGIAFAALEPAGRRWRLPFLAGLVGGGWLAALSGAALPVLSAPGAHGSTGLYIAGGLLVGIGTRVGNGCTSGHGVCGLSRLSRRSLIAVPVFMGVGMLSATFVRSALQ